MGGSQSSANPNDVANANTVLTNSKNKIDQPHTVIIPVDGSNQSEVAFQCEPAIIAQYVASFLSSFIDSVCYNCFIQCHHTSLLSFL